jgi:hypothetical protein
MCVQDGPLAPCRTRRNKKAGVAAGFLSFLDPPIAGAKAFA